MLFMQACGYAVLIINQIGCASKQWSCSFMNNYLFFDMADRKGKHEF
jgi:hypothetical protein